LETWIVLVPRTPKLRGQLPIRADIDRKNEKGTSREANLEAPFSCIVGLPERPDHWHVNIRFPHSRGCLELHSETRRRLNATSLCGSFRDRKGKKNGKLCTKYHGFVIRDVCPPHSYFFFLFRTRGCKKERYD
jgi:hypothetical protein